LKTKIIVLILILAAAVVVFVVDVRHEEGIHKAVIGLNAPDVVVTDASGNTLRLSGLKDTVVFVNFWATWCQPCREEVPSIQQLYSRLKDEPGFRMVTVLYRDYYDKGMDYLKRNNYDFPVWIDTGGKAARAYGVTGVPETYIVDRKGILREKVIGPTDWSTPEAMSLVTNLLRR
jgi:cytochrome c biogenesis protein CcmG/thiol:disulfide interchange protein DsbE